MLQLTNNTPYEAEQNLSIDAQGAERLTVVVKATFQIPISDQAAAPAAQQQPVLLSDMYFGEPGESSIKYPADLVMQKIATDIGLVGSAHSTDGMPATHILASIQAGSIAKQILVTGDRRWRKNKMTRRYEPSQPEPFTTMSLSYERAFGGAHDGACYAANPVGTGFRANQNDIEGQSLPNLEDVHQRLQSPADRVPVACFGFVAPMWEQRLIYAGTHDDQWRRHRFPLPPVDFNPRFFNAAAKGLVADGFLKGGEPVVLSNVSKTAHLKFNLPRHYFQMTMAMDKNRIYEQARIWTVLFEPDAHRFCMLWGATFDAGKQPGRIREIGVDMIERVEK